MQPDRDLLPYQKQEEEGKRSQEPAWLATALSEMEPEDRETLAKLRRSFDNRVSSGQWYYAEAGYDVTPALFAPEGTTLHFIDTTYTDPDDKGVHETLKTSFLRDSDDVTHVTSDHLVTEMDGDTSIHWVGQSTAEAAIPKELDCVFTASNSRPPKNDVMDHLRVHGTMVLKGNRVEQILDHPARLVNLPDLGFRSLTESPVRINNLQLHDAGDLMPFHKSGSATFTILEKTRELTDEEKLHMQLSNYCEEIFNLLLFRALPIIYEGTEHANGYMSDDDRLENLRTQLLSINKIIDAQSDTQVQARARQLLFDRVGQHFQDQSSALRWLIDSSTHIHDSTLNKFKDKNSANKYVTALQPLLHKLKDYFFRGIT